MMPPALTSHRAATGQGGGKRRAGIGYFSRLASHVLPAAVCWETIKGKLWHN